MRSTVVRASLMVVAALVLAAACSAAPDEVRAFWVDAWGPGVLNQTEVDKLLGVVGDPNQKGDIRNANCNTVIVQVRRNCDANYPSSMGEPYMGGLSPATFNSLQAVINAAHDTTGGKQRIDVHAWIVTFRTSGGTVYSQHSSTPTGSLTNLDNYWPTRDNTGAETSDKAFDPGHPLCEEYTVNVCMDLVTNFDIDGIHYDYIRFTANNQGYNPTSVARFNAIKGRTGQPDSGDEVFKQWRRDQVSALVRKVYAKVQSVKPWVKQSGSFVTWNPSPTASTRAAFQATRPYYDVYSDWDSWIQEGIVDLAVPMTYYNWASLPNDYVKWMNFEKDRKGSRHMAVGPGIYLNSLSNAILELQMTRDPSPSNNYAHGFSGYSYRVPYSGGTWEGFSPSLVSQVTPTSANIPAMPWKSSPTKGHISGTVTYFATGKWADGASVKIEGPQTRTMPCDGTGFYAFIDVTPGSYVITVSKDGYPDSQKTANVVIGAETGNMYIRDFALGGPSGPTISNVQATGITTTGATITWTTDQTSTSQVQYGLTTSYGSLTTLDPTLVTSHSMPLSGLTPGTTYHYRVISSNANGTTTSGDYVFTTVGPPAISNVQATGITNNAATITWTTDQAASSQVEYGLTTSYGSLTTPNPALVTSHSVALSGLTPNTLYHYRVISANVNGSRTSSDYTFTTSGPPTISNVQATNIGATGATITWTTSAPTDGKVNYGTTTSYGSQATDPNSNTTSHSVTLTGLTANTLYHYQCVSTNAYGTATSSDYTFTTTQVVVEIVIDNTDSGWTNTSPGGATWSVGSNAAVPKIGTNYLYAAGSGSESSVTRSCRWTPNLSAAGTYDVYVYYQIGANRNLRAPYKVYYNGGQVTSVQNQWSSTPNQGGWFLVGQDLPFLAGSAGYVELTNASTDTNYVSADAAKFVFKAPADSTAPVMSGVTDDMYTTSTTSLNGSWSASDPETGIQRYEYAVGTTSGGTQIKGWTSAGPATSAAIGGLSLTVGQTYYISARAVNGANLTSAHMSSSGVTVARSVASIADAKAFADTEPVALPTASTVSAKFTGYLYVEDPTERVSGIRVQSSAAVVVDQTAQVFGRLTLLDGMERALTSCKVIPGAMGTAVQPLEMVTRWLGGEALNAYTPGVLGGIGPNNVGLLVTIIGTVKEKQPGYIYVSDGSQVEDGTGNVGVRVDTTYLAALPEIGKQVVITGISTVHNTGTAHVRMVRPRSDADVTEYD